MHCVVYAQINFYNLEWILTESVYWNPLILTCVSFRSLNIMICNSYIQTEKIRWYLNHTLDDGIIDCLAGTYKRCLMKSIEWRVGPLSFNKRGGEGRKRRDYIYDRSKIQKLFIHDCIIGIVQNSIVKWKYGWQVLELHRSCSSRDDDRQHGAVNAGHLKRYILPLWLLPAPSRESFSNFPYVRP